MFYYSCPMILMISSVTCRCTTPISERRRAAVFRIVLLAIVSFRDQIIEDAIPDVLGNIV